MTRAQCITQIFASVILACVCAFLALCFILSFVAFWAFVAFFCIIMAALLWPLREDLASWVGQTAAAVRRYISSAVPSRFARSIHRIATRATPWRQSTPSMPNAPSPCPPSVASNITSSPL